MKRVRRNTRIGDWFRALSPRQRAWFSYLALALAVFAVYANVYQNAFMLDDIPLIVDNDLLRHWSGLPGLLGKNTIGPYYRPIQALVYFLVYQIFGPSQAAFHGLNVLLQALNACLVYRLGCRLGFYPRASFAAALLWGIHPVFNQQVALVSGTADLLLTFLFMMGLMALLPNFLPRKFWPASFLFVLSLGCKESAVVFPALATFALFLVSKERLKPATYIRTWPLWALAAAYLTGLLMCPVLINSLVSRHHVSRYFLRREL